MGENVNKDGRILTADFVEFTLLMQVDEAKDEMMGPRKMGVTVGVCQCQS